MRELIDAALIILLRGSCPSLIKLAILPRENWLTGPFPPLDHPLGSVPTMPVLKHFVTTAELNLERLPQWVSGCTKLERLELRRTDGRISGQSGWRDFWDAIR